jgi:hypothetical protein
MTEGISPANARIFEHDADSKSLLVLFFRKEHSWLADTRLRGF